MMTPWQMWKQSFAAWETTTSRYLENVLANPAVLGPAAMLMTAATKAKAISDRAAAHWWSTLGLPTRVDQERSLHKLNQLESRLLDLEEQLVDAHAQLAAARKAAAVGAHAAAVVTDIPSGQAPAE